ncbi:MAG: hypothetical protein Q7U60_00305, partial [Candidatus Methanoperedens sp.]|nr:hypothetical protein [Candidatus Methanoperedens sp.]
MKKLLFLFILLVFLPIVTAEKINGLEVEWGGWTSYPDLGYTNPSITKGDFVIKVIDFDWLGLVTISVTYKGETKYGIFTKGDETIFDFTKQNGTFLGIKIRADDISKYDRNSTTRPVNIGTFPCCPKAAISVAVPQEITQRKPKLELVLSTNWDGRLGYISTMNIQIRNTGDAAFSLGNVTINISGLKLASEKELSDQALTYNPSKETVARGWSTPFLAGNSYSLNLSLKSVLLNKS